MAAWSTGHATFACASTERRTLSSPRSRRRSDAAPARSCTRRRPQPGRRSSGPPRPLRRPLRALSVAIDACRPRCRSATPDAAVAWPAVATCCVVRPWKPACLMCAPFAGGNLCARHVCPGPAHSRRTRRRLLANELYNERTTPAYIESVAERHDREVIGMSGTAGAPNVATGQTARRCPLCGKPVTPDALGFLECSCGWGGADDPLLTAHGLTRWPVSARSQAAS